MRRHFWMKGGLAGVAACAALIAAAAAWSASMAAPKLPREFSPPASIYAKIEPLSIKDWQKSGKEWGTPAGCARSWSEFVDSSEDLDSPQPWNGSKALRVQQAGLDKVSSLGRVELWSAEKKDFEDQGSFRREIIDASKAAYLLETHGEGLRFGEAVFRAWKAEGALMRQLAFCEPPDRKLMAERVAGLSQFYKQALHRSADVEMVLADEPFLTRLAKAPVVLLTVYAGPSDRIGWARAIRMRAGQSPKLEAQMAQARPHPPIQWKLDGAAKG